MTPHHKKWNLAWGILLFLFFLPACQKKVTILPPCEIAPGHNLPMQGNAGCLIVINKKLLVVRTSKTGGMIGPPAGKMVSSDKSAQYTAHRETWEETGFNVLVGKLMIDMNGEFYLFQCNVIDGPKQKKNGRFPIPKPERKKITEIFLIECLSVCCVSL